MLLAQLLGQLFGELIQNVPTQGEVLVFLNSIKLANCIFYMYKIVISYFSVCPIITHEHLDGLASNFDWRTRENHENVLNLVFKF